MLNTVDGDQENIEVCGRGIIDGSGMTLYKKEIVNSTIMRGRPICLRNTRNCIIRDVTLCDTVGWTLHFVFCKNVKGENISIYAKRSSDLRMVNNELRNGDGLVVDSSEDVEIRRCIIESQDDCISIKLGRNAEGREIGIPSRHILITDCLFIGGAGVSIGSEMSGGVGWAKVKHCSYINVLSILSIKSNWERGGYISNIRIEDCSLVNLDATLPNSDDYKAAIYINEFYKIGTRKEYGKDEKFFPTVENIAFVKIRIVNKFGKAIFISGLSEAPIKRICMKDVRAYSVGDYEINNAEVFMEDVHIDGNISYRRK